MTTDLIAQPDRLPSDLTLAGRAADEAAARHIFADYRSRKAANTIRRQDADLTLFAQFLAQVGVRELQILNYPEVWYASHRDWEGSYGTCRRIQVCLYRNSQGTQRERPARLHGPGRQST